MSEIDYFAAPDCPIEAALRRIKGSYRRARVKYYLKEDGLDSIPPGWLARSLSPVLANFLGSQHPSFLGGEDLPDLEGGEVEVARMTLVNAVHGEVFSLRVRPADDGHILLRMVDEYETDYVLPCEKYPLILTSAEIIRLFREAEPSPMDTSCEIEFQSFFHPGLNDLLEDGTVDGECLE